MHIFRTLKTIEHNLNEIEREINDTLNHIENHSRRTRGSGNRDLAGDTPAKGKRLAKEEQI